MQLEDYVVDKTAEKEGRWFHIARLKTCVRVARWGNPKHVALMSAANLSRAERQQFLEGEVSYESRAARTLDEMAEAIFLDFGKCKAPDCPGGEKCEGIEHEGEPIENTQAHRREMLDRAPTFFAEINLLSRTESGFREKTLQKIAGNSGASSAGSASGRSIPKRSKSSSRTSKSKRAKG